MKTALRTIINIWSDFEVWASYAWSISVGTLMFTLLTLVASFMTGAAQESIAQAGIGAFVLLWCVFCIFYWTVAMLAALPPVTLVMVWANRLNLHTMGFYGLIGALTGFYLTPIYVAIDLPLYWLTADNPTFWQRFWAHLPWGILSCMAGGLTMWWRVRDVFPRARTPRGCEAVVPRTAQPRKL
jgi:hypothetical protein